MKKLLLATAAIALIAPAAQAEVKLDLGGYFKGYAGYASQDTNNLKKVDLKRKSQVFFTGETTLDNGLTVGYNGSLFQETEDNTVPAPFGANDDTQIERSYLYFSGNWGRVNLGRENGAAYLLQVSAPGADANLDGQDIAFSFYNPNGQVRQDYKQTLVGAQYADKISYLTPKFNGFQAGASFSPTVEQKIVNQNLAGQPLKNNTDYKNLWEVAARYDGEFSGVGIHAGAGYGEADASGLAITEDYKSYNAGLKFTVDAFGFGAAYLNEEADYAGAYDARTWVVGADYTYGAYTFGANYFNTKNKAANDDMDRITVGAGYTFGPGMKFNGSVGFYNGDYAAGDNDATVVTVGTDIQF